MKSWLGKEVFKAMLYGIMAPDAAHIEICTICANMGWIMFSSESYKDSSCYCLFEDKHVELHCDSVLCSCETMACRSQEQSWTRN